MIGLMVVFQIKRSDKFSDFGTINSIGTLILSYTIQ